MTVGCREKCSVGKLSRGRIEEQRKESKLYSVDVDVCCEHFGSAALSLIFPPRQGRKKRLETGGQEAHAPRLYCRAPHPLLMMAVSRSPLTVMREAPASGLGW